MTYVNDKPTGALIGRQAFGGGRASGTNDKVGSPLALQRWVNARYVKENFDAVARLDLPVHGPVIESQLASDVAIVNSQYVVVGAGLAGAATAWSLARRGHEVTLVERTQPAARDGSSHGSARIFRYAYPDPFYARLVVRGQGRLRRAGTAGRTPADHPVRRAGLRTGAQRPRARRGSSRRSVSSTSC